MTQESGTLPDYSIIDAHAHIMPWDLMVPDVLERFGIGHSDFDEVLALTSDPVRVLDYMDEHRIERMALINYVSKDIFGLMEDVNEFAAQFASHNPERFIPFGGIDPPTVKDVAAEMDHLLGDLGLMGIKIHPPHQLFRANAYVDQPELAGLAHERSLLLLDDLGSGCLLDTRPFGLPPEPTPQESLAAGADLVLFSGDKLLGGPQAGIVLGGRDLVSALRRHPLARAVRLDKTSIAGLAATLLHYLRGEALTKVPVWRMIAAPVADLERRARRWARACRRVGVPARVIEGRSMVGGGSLPEESLPSRLLAVGGDGSLKVEALARHLRTGDPPVVGRIERDALLLDPRTVDPRQDRALLNALHAALAVAAR